MNKRFGFLLTLLFTTTLLFAVSSATTPELHYVTDIQDHWAQSEIQVLLNAGVVIGEPNGEFQPDREITRAEFVTMLVKAYKT